MLRTTVLLSVMALALGACSDTARVNYRIDVEVDDNGVSRRGSRIWSFELTRPKIPLVSGYTPRFRGEAVPVPLPGRGTLFALVAGRSSGDRLSSDAMPMLPERVLQPQWPERNSDRIRGLSEISQRRAQTRILDCAGRDKPVCPVLVTFADIEDPRTIIPVEPADFEARFGKGVHLKRIAVTVTDEPAQFSPSPLYPTYANRPDWVAWKSSLPAYDFRTAGPDAFKRED